MATESQTLASVRKVLPKQFQDRFDRLWKRQRQQLLKIVGSPPDPSKISKSQWKKWQDEQAAALLALMLGYTISQTRLAIEEIEAMQITNTDRLRSGIDRRIMRGMRDRAQFAARSITQTTQSRLENGSLPEDVLNDSRSRAITTTEMTAARSQSVIGMYLELRRMSVACELVWRLRPCQHCEVCPLLDGTTHDFWSQFITNGPPMHPNCCCQLELIFGERDRLLRRRRIKSGPPARNVRQAIQRAGFRVR